MKIKIKRARFLIMEELYAKAAEKVKQMEADGVDMIQYHNDLRKRVTENLVKMGKDNGLGDGSIESILQSTLSPEDKAKLEIGLKRREEINAELLPWLKENNFKYTDPTTMAVLFVLNNKGVRFSICKQTANIYDVELYTQLISSGPYIDKKLGYNKSKKFMTEGLKSELLKLRDWSPA